MLEVLVRDMCEFRYSKVLPDVHKGLCEGWVEQITVLLRKKKNPKPPLQEGQVA